MPDRCAALGKPCPTGCGGCNSGLRSGTHSCTPQFETLGTPPPAGIYAINSSKILREARGGPDARLIFNDAEIASGMVCVHFRAMAERQFSMAHGTTPSKRSPGRPRKTPSPEGNSMLCTVCTGPFRKHLLAKGGRVHVADQMLSDAVCDAAEVAHGTLGCKNCKRAMQKRARQIAARAQEEKLQDAIRSPSAEENWADFMRPENSARIDALNRDMERRLCEYDVPDHPGLQANFRAYLKNLGCDDGQSPTDEQARLAKLHLAQQGNILYGSVLGRPGAKSVINGFQRGLAWIVKHGSDETSLRALHRCGITVAVRTANRMENDAATRWKESLQAALKPYEDYAGWVDNINAVVFPGFFENRTRTDRHATDFNPAELSAVSATDAKTYCNCTTKGMCDKSCACLSKLIKCHPNFCSCPCTLLRRVTAELGGGMMSRWVTEKETAISLATDATVISPTQAASADPVFVQGESEVASTCRNMNCITSTLGNMSRSDRAPPETRAYFRPECKLSDVSANMLELSGMRVDYTGQAKHRTSTYLAEIIDATRQYVRLKDDEGGWRKVMTVTVGLVEESPFEVALQEALKIAAENNGGELAVDIRALTVHNASSKISELQQLYALLARDDRTVASTVKSLRPLIRREVMQQRDEEEIARRAAIDEIVMGAVSRGWRECWGQPPTDAYDSNNMAGWRRLLNDLTKGNSRSQSLRAIKHALAVRLDPERMAEFEEDDGNSMAPAQKGELNMKLVAMQRESPGNFLAIQRANRNLAEIAGLSEDPLPFGEKVPFPWSRSADTDYQTPAHPAVSHDDGPAVLPPRLSTVYQLQHAYRWVRPAATDDDAVVSAAERASILVTGMDWGVKQFVVDEDVGGHAHPRILHGTAALHMWFSGAECLRDKYYDELGSVEQMTAAMNVLSQAQETFLVTPQARMTKMVDSVKKYVYALGIRAVLYLIEHCEKDGVSLDTLTPEIFAAEIPAVLESMQEQHCRLRAELELVYDFFVLYDFWRAARDGCEHRVMTNFAELGHILWSCTEEGGSGKLRHPKKADEWLSDMLVIAMASPRMHCRLGQQMFSKYRGEASDATDQVPSAGDREHCRCDASGHCVSNHVGHKNFRDANQESTNMIIKGKGGTEQAHQRRSMTAHAADQTLAPHRRPDVARSTTEQRVDSKRFRGVTFAILEKLPPAAQRIPPWKRVWVRGDKLIKKAAALRRVTKKKRMEHKRGAGDTSLKRSLSQIKAADALREQTHPRPGSCNYWVAGGRAADDRWQPYDDRLLRHRQGEDGEIITTGGTKPWLIDTRAYAEQQICEPSRSLTTPTAADAIGSSTQFVHRLKRFATEQDDALTTRTKRAKEAAAKLRTAKWWEETHGLNIT